MKLLLKSRPFTSQLTISRLACTGHVTASHVTVCTVSSTLRQKIIESFPLTILEAKTAAYWNHVCQQVQQE